MVYLVYKLPCILGIISQTHELNGDMKVDAETDFAAVKNHATQLELDDTNDRIDQLK